MGDEASSGWRNDDGALPSQDQLRTPKPPGPPVGLSLEIIENDDYSVQSASFSRCPVADLPDDLASGMTLAAAHQGDPHERGRSA